MSLESKTIKELKSMAKKKQMIECPSYSKMNKQELIQYLSSFRESKARTPIDSLQLARKRLSPQKRLLPQKRLQTDAIRHQQILQGIQKDKRNYSPVQYEPSNLSEFSFADYPQKPTRKSKKLSPRKSSGPYALDKVFKENQKNYRTPKVYKKKSSDPYYLDKVFKSPTYQRKRTVRKPKKLSGTIDSLSNMKVVDLKKECKKLGLKTSGKKSELIRRLKQKQKFDLARKQLNKTVRPKNNSITSAEARVARSLDKLLD